MRAVASLTVRASPNIRHSGRKISPAVIIRELVSARGPASWHNIEILLGLGYTIVLLARAIVHP